MLIMSAREDILSSNSLEMGDAPGTTESLLVEVKADPEADIKPSVSALDPPAAPVAVKYEEPEDGTIDSAIPIADDSDDMFGDAEEQDDEDDEEGETEDEIVDFTYEGLVHIQGVEHFVCRAFKIRQIPQPEVRMIDLGSLFGCLEYGSIILNPEYQREAVWDEHRASTLISSLSMGYFVPPIIFNRKLVITETPEGKRSELKKVCVDGKQRLTSIYKFMKGQIGIWDSNNPQKKWFFCQPTVEEGEEAEDYHNIMPQAVRDFFMQRRLCCYEYEELSKDTEENMFQLVQRGIALTPAEKMRAMSTEWSAFTRQYVEDYSIVVNLSKQHRASGFRSVLTIFAMIQEVMADRTGPTAMPILQASAQALNKLLEDKEPINPVLKLKFKTIFDRIETLVKLSSTQLTATKYKLNKNSVFDPAPDFLREEVVSHVRTFSPLELICTAVLVSYHMENRTNKQLLEDVKKLRHRLRIRHKDLRVNTDCWRTAWDFISRLGTPAEAMDYVPPPRRKKAVKKPSKRATKPKKAKPGSRTKKQPRSNPRPKALRKPPVTRKAKRVRNTASSSGLSSAPSSDAESSDEFTSGISSPLFPNILLATRGGSSSRAQSQAANHSDHAFKMLSRSSEPTNMAIDDTNAQAHGDTTEDEFPDEDILSSRAPPGVSDKVSSTEEVHANDRVQVDSIQSSEGSSFVNLEGDSIPVKGNNTSSIPENQDQPSDQATDVGLVNLELEGLRSIKNDSQELVKLPKVIATLESQEITTDLTDHDAKPSNPPQVYQPHDASEVPSPKDGFHIEQTTELVEVAASGLTVNPASEESEKALSSSPLPTPIIKTEPDEGQLKIPHRMPPFTGTNPPPKPKSRFKPRVPPRPERRPDTSTLSASVVKTEPVESISKRPRNGSPSRFDPPTKKPRENGHR